MLNTLNQSAKGVSTFEHVMAIDNGVLRKLRFDVGDGENGELEPEC